MESRTAIHSRTGTSLLKKERYRRAEMNSDEMSDAPQSAGLDSVAAGAWNVKKFKEESDLMKSRLTDQKFKIST